MNWRNFSLCFCTIAWAVVAVQSSDILGHDSPYIETLSNRYLYSGQPRFASWGQVPWPSLQSASGGNLNGTSGYWVASASSINFLKFSGNASLSQTPDIDTVPVYTLSGEPSISLVVDDRSGMLRAAVVGSKLIFFSCLAK